MWPDMPRSVVGWDVGGCRCKCGRVSLQSQSHLPLQFVQFGAEEARIGPTVRDDLWVENEGGGRGDLGQVLLLVLEQTQTPNTNSRGATAETMRDQRSLGRQHAKLSSIILSERGKGVDGDRSIEVSGLR